MLDIIDMVISIFLTTFWQYFDIFRANLGAAIRYFHLLHPKFYYNLLKEEIVLDIQHNEIIHIFKCQFFDVLWFS